MGYSTQKGKNDISMLINTNRLINSNGETIYIIRLPNQ